MSAHTPAVALASAAAMTAMLQAFKRDSGGEKWCEMRLCYSSLSSASAMAATAMLASAHKCSEQQRHCWR
jgi:hypothetical protein